MAIVLPRGTLKNYNDEYVRRFILTHCRVVAVVGLSGEMFKPYTNTKTCVLFLQKRPAPLLDLSEAESDPEIAYCQTTNPGKDKSGKVVYKSDGTIDSDMTEIEFFIKENAVWL